ncbi:MAG TPA: hypothetical protein VK479_06825 [Micropepsaceae bacterium]|nr:hypothetical protein [Micropepsaceae bacterium]
MDRPATVERAYQLAESGDCATVDDIKSRLQQEGYSSVGQHLAAPTLTRALRRLCAAAVKKP